MPTHPPTEQEERDRVLAYLRSHPDLLDRHPELLADLIIPHGAGSASLIERQVQVLRERNLRLEGTLDELLRHARQNEALLDKVHELALALLRSTDLSVRIEVLVHGLVRHFHAETVRLVLPRQHPAARCERAEPLCLTLEDWPGPPVEGEPCCGPLDPALAGWLFPAPDGAPASAALIALPGHAGVLFIGSHDPHRFHRHMGTDVLRRLGDLAGAALQEVDALAEAPR
ncbi:MAG TPA: DUF484 family protein [Candidatus Macondimonas sp.]|nr:DUF484 family protein [Candidatus Macondimonas sp.]